ncbi:hypothetical protein PAXINDRAFT_14700 [Paxillus involutus ATCC 200175]|uniref:Uncharacterized protein n=1 Tax=Paxillus involutus ATCC 200175 TaxID=664439 RepID=A0A0C9TPM7_PAXIN|nr:hypothetical protein PAXINDRAFT_14700 [Paxillus involutus ATCC 200175]
MDNITLPPLNLPSEVERLLIRVFHQDITFVQECWALLKAVIWSQEEFSPTAEEIELYNVHGLVHGIAFSDLFPPTRVASSTGVPITIVTTQFQHCQTQFDI